MQPLDEPHPLLSERQRRGLEIGDPRYRRLRPRINRAPAQMDEQLTLRAGDLRAQRRAERALGRVDPQAPACREEPDVERFEPGQ